MNSPPAARRSQEAGFIQPFSRSLYTTYETLHRLFRPLSSLHLLATKMNISEKGSKFHFSHIALGGFHIGQRWKNDLSKVPPDRTNAISFWLWLNLRLRRSRIRSECRSFYGSPISSPETELRAPRRQSRKRSAECAIIRDIRLKRLFLPSLRASALSSSESGLPDGKI